ncbi:ATP-binding protein [Coprococcus comes]|uniref:ATP-binding protein n=1 Tax=Coprococcus comes TaxID=410072 RepID=UPI001C015218|nr:4Fe-4S binding protein [Coprococcus comes]MBT9781578.1 ferredoxin [Coprococcus comes]
MIRRIIQIDEEKCNGCGACAKACHEGAISMVNGKAKLMRDDYCDGLGDCLPNCPVDAIHFVEREAAAYDAEAVKQNMLKKQQEEATKQNAGEGPKAPVKAFAGGCPGTRMRMMNREESMQNAESEEEGRETAKSVNKSMLSQWPVQIKLAPVNAPYFDGAKLLVAADCSAYAYGDFHNRFIKGHVTLIGCPKLDNVDYSEKLTEIIKNNNIKSVTIVRMEVPCCGGLELAAKKALQESGKFIPWQVVTLSLDGQILDE